MRFTTPCRIRASDLVRRGPILAALLALAACQQTGRLDPGFQGLPPPPGTPRVTEAVDGLTVGHRLMAAGEYELALDAYYRAAAEQGLSVDVLSAVGSANLRLGRLGQAETMLRRALKKDERFVPAWNNLGVVLMEKGETGEARRVFETAFALDSGQSDDIRQNLLLAIEKTANPSYDPANDNDFKLVRRGSGQYLLIATP
ncbi:tetratricopeptide repeat protein [Rhodovulum steppense]|uniref:Tetratricopeptide repeat protein n=1 Tax=Rhodovulum steppense TaxID=540251 RepID=A0A4R1YUM8_9RHOB|nr:tetratricopeptide repeat protein [Rhodovulum steppense]TCM84473.1 tetratricopeptide repeat protein [Rhodovulum steppense]